MFSREIGRPKTAKVKIYFSFEGCRGFRGAAFILFRGGGGGVHLVQVVQGAGSAGSLSVCVPSLCPAFCPLCCIYSPAIVPKYALFRILRRFSGCFGVGVWVCSFWCFVWIVGLLCA